MWNASSETCKCTVVGKKNLQKYFHIYTYQNMLEYENILLNFESSNNDATKE